MQRGRKSAASEVGFFAANQADGRPPPLAHLSPPEQAEWIAAVKRMPPNWFTPETWPILEDLCNHIACLKLVMAKKRAMLGDGGYFDLGELSQLSKIHDRESRIIVLLSTKLRLTPQSKHSARVAQTAYRDAQNTWEAAAA